MKTQYTPGPWTLYQKSGQRVRVIGKQQRHICTMADPAIDDDARIQAANARLIASAPELLEALEALMEFWDNGTPVNPGAEVVSQARAAIAKTKGETL